MALAPLALSCLPALALAVIYELVGTFGLFFSFNHAGRSAKPAVRVEIDLPETHEPAAVAAVEDERADGTISLYMRECIEEADEPGAEIELGAMHMAYRSWCKKRVPCSVARCVPQRFQYRRRRSRIRMAAASEYDLLQRSQVCRLTALFGLPRGLNGAVIGLKTRVGIWGCEIRKVHQDNELMAVAEH
jgi:hypothetical protein